MPGHQEDPCASKPKAALCPIVPAQVASPSSPLTGASNWKENVHYCVASSSCSCWCVLTAVMSTAPPCLQVLNDLDLYREGAGTPQHQPWQEPLEHVFWVDVAVSTL